MEKAMFGAIQKKSKLVVVLITLAFLAAGWPFPSSGDARPKGFANASVGKPLLTGGAAMLFQSPSPTYNLLLQDDSTGNMLRWNSTTGQYLYSRCSDGFTLTGTGTVSSHGSTYTLTHNPADRRVQATLDNTQHSGTASVQYPLGSTTQTITDRSTTPDLGATDTTPPQVAITAPNGGEIIDAQSSFTISWESTDDVGVASHDILYSTDGGSTYATIVTGLAGSVNQYAWSVPAMVNNKTVRVRVLARDAACNASRDDSDANFMVWNPPASFTHLAEAPLFFSGQGFTSTVYLTNTSANAVVVELDPHQANGNATQNFPYQVLLNAGASATVDTASLYTIGTDPENSAFTDQINGGIRLRHNGAQDSDVRAMLVVERGCAEEFTTPFAYAASALSASGTMQCSPMYYVDSAMDTYVAFQNVTNVQQMVQLTCNYGTGVTGTPNGQFKNQPIVLGPQQTRIVNLKSVLSAFGGAEWGSMDVFTSAPRAVVCHSVMMSAEEGMAWDCPFMDPAMCVSTTKVAQAVTLDYNNSENAYLMLCNMSASDSRTVTASFKTSNGITIAPVQATLAPGAQKMITLDARQLLQPGSSTVADVRLTYTGNASDIAAAGCSMSPSASRAVAVKFKEASANDGRRLMSPYFRFDENISGQVLISNLGTSSIKVGARIVFANSTAKPVKTAAVTIAAGGVATIDLSSVGDVVPDGVVAAGRVDLIHSGPAGTVTAAVTESGCYNSAQVVPLDGGVAMDPLTLFPVAAVVIPGGCAVADAISDGTVTDPVLTNPGGCYGTLIQTYASGSNTFQTTLCVPTNCVGDVPLVYTPAGGGASDESDFTVTQTSAASFSTPLGTRLNPMGTTPFTITANSAFPNARLQVEFAGKGGSVFSEAHGDGVSTLVSGTGPVNHTFLGNVKKIFVRQLNDDGSVNTSAPLVLKVKNSGAYFALDRPTSITLITPNAVPVTGGTVTIKGGGFQFWQLDSGTVNPTVLIGGTNLNKHDQIRFTVIAIPDSGTIIGNVGPTPSDVGTCADIGRTPCKAITLINPGGSDGVDNLTSQELLTVNGPAPPVIDGTAALSVTGQPGPATSNSIGMQNVRLVNGVTTATPVTARIIGRNLNRVKTVTFVGAVPVTIGPSNVSSDGTRIELSVPAFCVTGSGGANTVSILVDDGVNVVTFMNGWIYTTTGPLLVSFPNVPIGAVAYLAGPCEDVTVTTTLTSDGYAFVDCSFQIVGCIKVTSPGVNQHGILSPFFPNANIAVFSWGRDCSGCTPGTMTNYFRATATNVRSMTQLTSCLQTTCTR
jgi:hypothetical protein